MYEQLLQLWTEHQVAIGSLGAALVASFAHAKAGNHPICQKTLAMALPGIFHTPLAKALAVDVAKAVLKAWDEPQSEPEKAKEPVYQTNAPRNPADTMANPPSFGAKNGRLDGGGG